MTLIFSTMPQHKQCSTTLHLFRHLSGLRLHDNSLAPSLPEGAPGPFHSINFLNILTAFPSLHSILSFYSPLL